MGPLTLRRFSPPTWWCAFGSVAVASAALVATVAGSDPQTGPAVLAGVSVAVLVVGLVAGFGGPVVASACGQVGVVAWTSASTGGGVGVSAVLVALGIWLSFELACTSFELRADVDLEADAAQRRAADVLGVAAFGGTVAAVALVAADSGPSWGELVSRSLGVLVVVATVGAVLLLSRRLRVR